MKIKNLNAGPGMLDIVMQNLKIKGYSDDEIIDCLVKMDEEKEKQKSDTEGLKALFGIK